MQLKKVRVKNFKAIDDATLDLTDATLLVGSNNAGKSSILQAIHFASRAIAQASEANKQSTISLNELEYIPSTDYRELGHFGVWGNVAGTPESRVEFTFENPVGNNITASVVLKSARNEGISVNPKIDPSLITILRSKENPFTAYIPGIAGVPLQEQPISKRNVFRKVASGDSNVVLRNILLLIKRSGKTSILERFVRGVFNSCNLEINFNEEVDYYIRCSSTVANLGWRYKPLEYCGTGFLQVLQIFSYLILFKPKMILIDEPESHLHPPLQTRLVREVQKRASEFGAVALISTHSPYVARGLSIDANTIWIDKGKVAAAGTTTAIRDALGWGALDKSIILCTEDENTSLLRRILSQSSVLEDKISIFPFNGVSKLGTKQLLQQLRQALGNHHHIVVHRDGDCMDDTEIANWKQVYQDTWLTPWVTSGSDLEMYFCDPAYLTCVTGVDLQQAVYIRDQVIEDDSLFKDFENKRKDINNRFYQQSGGSPSTQNLWENLPLERRIKGKDLLSRLRYYFQNNNIPNGSKLGKICSDIVVAADLLSLLSTI